MPVGRKPKPAERRRAEGNPGKRPIPTPADIGDRLTKAPPAPQQLSLDAQEAWRVLAPILCRSGVLRTGDLIAFEAMCEAVARMRQAGRVLNDEGPMSVGSMGQPVEHPAVKMRREGAAEFRQWAERFGLDPSSRTRLGVTNPDPDGFDDLPELQGFGAPPG